MQLRKPKQFTVDRWTITVDGEDWPRVRALVPLMRATADPVVFLVNHGTKDRPVFQPLSAFILKAPGAYVVLKDRSDPGDHRKANLVKQ
jgi:hypothetical protein